MKATLLTFLLALSIHAAENATVNFSIDCDKDSGKLTPRVGFLGGVRDDFPDSLYQALHPAMFRIGHQFRGRVKTGLNGAIDRVQSFGAKYKLVMSDLIHSWPDKGKDWKDFDWAKYEADVKKLVASVGTRAQTVLWEPANEPDVNIKPIDNYYNLYAHAFKALREVETRAQITGPGYAFPSYDKYRAFLKYCQENKLECNEVCFHYTGWDPHYPEQAKWNLGKMRDFLAEFPEQKISEIHCDEWGAGPDKPGRLHPGRAVIWFHYLQNVYKVDRACRANWGNADDFIGGIVTPRGEPYPVYHVYRWYGEMAGNSALPCEGSDKNCACVASKSSDRYVILVGSVNKKEQTVQINLRGIQLKNFNIEARMIPNTQLDSVLLEKDIPAFKDFTTEDGENGAKIVIGKLEENQACEFVLTKK